MFFLIPIGSEEGVRRLPYFTIGLILINAVIFVITSNVQNQRTNEWMEINKKLIEIETYYVHKIIETDPLFLTRDDLDAIHERFLTDNIIPQDSEDYEVWKRLYEEYKIKSITVFDQYGVTPKKFDFFKMFSSMFIHGDFFHLLFNMLFLWLVGCNIEDDWSWKVFCGLYLVSGVAAVLMHVAMFPNSSAPLIGASGAIAGIMGAFMIRHYKTKIRLAWFIWVFITRPFFGTFSVYAGIALPIWFLMEIGCASRSVEVGTAHWAHIGGFVFGALIGVSMRFLGIEKKYVAPMVEESFEKLKMSPKMKEANKRLDAGDTAGAMPLLLAVINEEPYNADAPLTLARVYYEKGHLDDAVVMYNKAIEAILRIQDKDLLQSTKEELKEKDIINKLTEKNMYSCAAFLEGIADYEEAVKLFGLYTKIFPNGKVRSKVIYRTYLLFKNKLNNEAMAQSALVFLKKEYPDFPIAG